ncbi:MAG: hypothetical protein ACPH7H_06130 [Porticoccaceae bacterium]
MLRRYPKSREVLKRIALTSGYYFNRFFKDEFFTENIENVEFFRIEGHSTFFGYYDLCPDNSDGLVLANSINNNTGKKQICVFSDDCSSPIINLEVEAMNLQIGLRAQWLDSDLIGFNNLGLDQCSPGYRIFSTSKNKIIHRGQDFLHTAISNDMFVSVNPRLIAFHDPHYGYCNHKRVVRDEIEVLKIINYDGEIVFSVNKYDLGSNCEDFCINHVQVCPEYKTLTFIQRNLNNGKRKDRLWRLNLDDYTLSPITEWCVISHYCFESVDRLIIYFSHDRKKFAYHKLNLRNHMATKIKCLDGYRDGHPSFQNGMFLTDTYADLAGYQTLYYGNLINESVKPVLRLPHHPKFYGESRCDLHPRFSFHQDFIYFDTVCLGYRTLARINIDYLH